MLLVNILVPVTVHIVEAHDAASIGDAGRVELGRLLAAFELVIARGDGTCGVNCLRPRNEVLLHLLKIRNAARSLGHLVAKGPHDDGRGVDIALHGLLEIKLGPRF